MADEQTKKQFPQEYYRYDKSEAKKIIQSLPDHMREGYKLADDVRIEKPFDKVVIAGMGGSGIAGRLLATIVDKEMMQSLVNIHDYDIPKDVNEHTLFIAVSYSGNTEETLSAYKLAVRRGAQAVLISSGGKAEELAKINKHSFIKLPKGLQPRMAVAYLLMPLIKLLENAKAIPSHAQEIKELIELLKRQNIEQNAIDLSAKLYEKTPLIYADTTYYPVAYRWKTQFNENAKTTAFCHEFSELNHNELVGFSNRMGSYHVIILTTDSYHRRVLKRIALTKDILQKKGVPVTEIAVKGSPLHNVMTMLALGDLTSYYLALRYELDPTPVVVIEQLKKDLGPFLI